MSNVTSIFKNRDKTKPEHDTMRQVSNSEMPSGLNETLEHIARAPNSIFWYHSCPKMRMDSIPCRLGNTCLHCRVDEFGVHHGRGGAT